MNHFPEVPFRDGKVDSDLVIPRFGSKGCNGISPGASSLKSQSNEDFDNCFMIPRFTSIDESAWSTPPLVYSIIYGDCTSVQLNHTSGFFLTSERKFKWHLALSPRLHWQKKLMAIFGTRHAQLCDQKRAWWAPTHPNHWIRNPGRRCYSSNYNRKNTMSISWILSPLEPGGSITVLRRIWYYTEQDEFSTTNPDIQTSSTHAHTHSQPSLICSMVKKTQVGLLCLHLKGWTQMSTRFILGISYCFSSSQSL